jgi:acyl-CoA dehydrogenase
VVEQSNKNLEGIKMDFSLSEEQSLIVETVREFVEKELYPHEDLVEKLDDIPEEIAKRIQDKAIKFGLYAPNMPESVGGAGLDAVSLVLVERELGRASFALQSLVGRPSNILMACKGSQIEKYLLPAVRGEKHDCLAMTEPEAGSDVRSMRTRAIKNVNGYLINGTKHFISHADRSDFVILFAATGVTETSKGPRNEISAFLIDIDTPGLTVTRGSQCVSHRGYHQCELSFVDVQVDANTLLGEEGRGLELMGEWLGAARLVIAANSVGRAQRILESTIDWVSQRKQFGKNIGQYQGVSFPLADSITEVAAAELLTLQAASKLDIGKMTDTDAAMAKLFATETLGRVADRAVQAFGGMGLMSEAKIERWWRDARVERIWDGTSEIQRHIISRAILRPLEK